MCAIPIVSGDTPDDNAMSAAEYVAKSKELGSILRERNEAIRAAVMAKPTHSKDAHKLLLDVFESWQRRPEAQHIAGIVVRFCADGTATVKEHTYMDAPLFGASVVIEDVHNAPTRCESVPPHDAPLQTSLGAAMRAQQDSGKYPTLEDHAKKRSDTWTVRLDAMGNFIQERV